MPRSGSNSVAVIKLGGSIFGGLNSYARAARFIAQRLDKIPGENLAVVVSALQGETDALLREAQETVTAPNEAALDLLWSTGELRSVARLALHLQAQGVCAATLDVRQAGLRIPARGASVLKAELNSAGIRRALARHRVVIVPGFLATNREGAVVSLARGGSDLTAVLVAAELGASRCELIKDVPGFFSADPHTNSDAKHLPWLSFVQAVDLAKAGCELVQQQAIEAAQRFDLPLLVRSLEESKPPTWVSATPEISDCAYARARKEADVFEAASS